MLFLKWELFIMELSENSKISRVMVDMSATLIHHGHIKLLQKAKKYGYLIALAIFT